MEVSVSAENKRKVLKRKKKSQNVHILTKGIKMDEMNVLLLPGKTN